MTDAAVSLRPGDRVPFCYGMLREGDYWSFEDQAGRPAVLVATGRAGVQAADRLIAAFAARREAFAALGADLVVVGSAMAPGAATATVPARVRLLLCPDDPLGRALGDGPWVLATDRAMRLAALARADEAEAAVMQMLAALAALPREAQGLVSCPAPVLVVPGVLDADACARMIARFEGGDHVEGAMASVDGEDGLVNRVDAAKKQRRDLVLDPGEALHAEVMAALSGRLIPEIKKAFQAEVAFVDRALIARYDDTGGYFKRHRDNASPHVAFREFAVSLNLNTGDYDGGGLIFPEFNDCEHQPPRGAACVFSASLLHEASPVTRGRRYVLLTFVHGHAAEARRLAAQAASSPLPAGRGEAG
jgi:predicted 2-oxoglutarate/Fe(II)-dependent dioxygenase YbiX